MGQGEANFHGKLALAFQGTSPGTSRVLALKKEAKRDVYVTSLKGKILFGEEGKTI